MDVKDHNLLNYLEGFLTENRKEGFLRVLQNRTKHFTIAMEDVYQLHNTSAVMRSCEVFGIQELNVIEQKFGKRIDSEIAMGAQKWVDVFRFNSVQGCLDSMREKGYQIIATSPHNDSCLLHEFDITKQRICLHHCFECFHVHVHLTFIIACTACINSTFRMLFSLLYNRLERW